MSSCLLFFFFFFNDTATTEIYTLSLHDALPISLFAPFHRLDNLVAIVDYNKIQSLGRVKDVLDLEPFGAKWKAFGWAVREIDGHDLGEVLPALVSVPFEKTRPSCIIAHTVKGKGVSFMEDKLLWHYRPPNDEEFEKALAELEAAE